MERVATGEGRGDGPTEVGDVARELARPFEGRVARAMRADAGRLAPITPFAFQV